MPPSTYALLNDLSFMHVTAGCCLWVAVVSSVPLRRLLSPHHASLVSTAAFTGVIPASFDRHFCSSPLQSTLLPRSYALVYSGGFGAPSISVFVSDEALCSGSFSGVFPVDPPIRLSPESFFWLKFGGDSHGRHVSPSRHKLTRGV
ncbi:hypothetical protein F2Q69_00000242 [Brassica cretica]|uniref:Uncharacterized protein n=1 Tax=Brassica cretica TaxID=69181 RepID=A0A8S9PDY3_BRACR|nr:hypothetical protein F2Q69_00000242 [Brassica cretica]